MPLDPKQVVDDAERMGLILRGTDLKTCELQTPTVRFENRPVFLPAEVGLAPLPKTDRRSRAYRQRPKQPRKWLTKAEAIAKGYSL